MSEDFDKEAEREKLREKYEREEAKRETTEQMSELLLKGATMTNAHCSDCGDPIFRYDGQEFCPTCQKPIERDAGGDDADDESTGVTGGGDEEAGETPADGDTETIEVTSPSDEARVQFGSGDASERAPTDEGAATAVGTDTDDDSAEPTQPRRRPDRQSDSGRQSESDRRPDPRRQPAPARPPESASDRASDVSAARASLVRTLTRFSERAESAEDPRRAREHLAAAREAAEALSALRR